MITVRNIILFSLLSQCTTSDFNGHQQVTIAKNNLGMKLVVDGEDFMINGMNWDYYPIGTNYTYNLWDQPDDFIRTALNSEMLLLKNMGVNAVRLHSDVPPNWIDYIYRKFGIYTVLNHTFGRYGLNIEGELVTNTDYADLRTRELLLSEVKDLAEAYKGTAGLLLYLLGNENNYGLFWEGAETEDFPVSDSLSEHRARPLYSLFNEAAIAMKAIDPAHPVAICNGDLQFLDIIAEECRDIDILGTNMYRGVSFYDVLKHEDAFQKVKDDLDIPILFTELGADAFNAIEKTEDQLSQAYYLLANWNEIYTHAAGMGNAGNAIGGFTFQFSDGWWKYKQTKNLEVHDTNASWNNGGYQYDYVQGENNMNEEWFGICAKGETDKKGHYPLYPRAAFYALKEIHTLNPYAEDVNLETVNEHFLRIQLVDALQKATHQ